ncbi:hypothetical protein ABS71_05265 [bacterium SCN 62-11]|nr:MAG: hypothetical protein ABS71_05265 [bacterium SCN 62-11]
MLVKVAPEFDIDNAVQVVFRVAFRPIAHFPAFENASLRVDEKVIGQVGPVLLSLAPALQGANFLESVLAVFPKHARMVQHDQARSVFQGRGQPLCLRTPFFPRHKVGRLRPGSAAQQPDQQ